MHKMHRNTPSRNRDGPTFKGREGREKGGKRVKGERGRDVAPKVESWIRHCSWLDMVFQIQHV